MLQSNLRIDKKTSKNINPYIMIILILIIALSIRLIYIQERWINPDEGAHLFDAKFAIEGKIPVVDYESRMPIYVYILAGFLKLFGISLLSGRFMALFSTLGIGFFIFLIGKLLFDSRIGLLASGIYLFSPTTILWSVVTKTEPVTTFFVCISMYLALLYTKKNRNQLFLFFSGAILGLTYYIRETAIAGLFALFIFIMLINRKSALKGLRNYMVLVFGFASIIFIILIFFGSIMGPADAWNSRLNPLNPILEGVQNILIPGTNHTYIPSIRTEDQSTYGTIWEWYITLRLNMFLIIGLFIPPIVLNKIYKNQNFIFEKEISRFILLYAWVFALLFFYIYYTIKRGFYNQYFGELVPPLTILFSYSILLLISELKIETKRKRSIIIIVIICLLYIAALRVISPSFCSVWSPDTVKKVSQYLKSSVNDNDTVLSGGMIWTFESNKKPFLNITHPLGFRPSISEIEFKQIENELLYNSPKFIILDGYTEQTYIRHIPQINDLLNNSYTLKKEVGGSEFDVKVYELNQK